MVYPYETLPFAHLWDIIQDTHDVPSHPLAHLWDIKQNTANVPACPHAHILDIGQHTLDVSTCDVSTHDISTCDISTHPVAHVSNTHDVPSHPLQAVQAAVDYHEGEDDYYSNDAAGDETVMLGALPSSCSKL